MWESTLLLAARRAETLTLSAVESDVDVWALLGSPTDPLNVSVIITDTAEITGFSLVGFDPASSIHITSAGYILGHGGRGGNGVEEGPFRAATPGAVGGHGITLVCPTVLDLTSGWLFAGGGGGGGGGDISYGGGGGGVHDGLGGDGGDVGLSGPFGAPSTTGPTATPGAGGGSGGDGGAAGQAGTPGTGPNSSVAGLGGVAINKQGFLLTYSGTDQATLQSQGRLVGSVV